jgi:hypothetical protein
MGHRLAVCLVLSIAVLGCGGKSGPDKVVSDYKDVRDSMCACPDQKDSTGCMRAALADLRAWKTAHPTALGSGSGEQLTEEQRNHIFAMRSELLQCCTKADFSGGNECMDTVLH